MTTRPAGYKSIPAHETSISKARETKEGLGLNWNEFLENAAEALENQS